MCAARRRQRRRAPLTEFSCCLRRTRRRQTTRKDSALNHAHCQPRNSADAPGFDCARETLAVSSYSQRGDDDDDCRQLAEPLRWLPVRMTTITTAASDSNALPWLWAPPPRRAASIEDRPTRPLVPAGLGISSTAYRLALGRSTLAARSISLSNLVAHPQ